MQFLNGLLGVDATYYKKVTTNQIMQVNISNSTGFEKLQLNAGEIENKGVELQLNLGILRKPDGFNWDMNLNWAENNSKVNKLYEDPITKQKLEAYTRDYFQSLWGGKETGIIDGSFVKLRQIELGYMLPATITNKVTWLKGAGLSVFAHNVALLYTHKSNVANIDPETGFGLGNDGLRGET